MKKKILIKDVFLLKKLELEEVSPFDLNLIVTVVTP